MGRGISGAVAQLGSRGQHSVRVAAHRQLEAASTVGDSAGPAPGSASGPTPLILSAVRGRAGQLHPCAGSGGTGSGGAHAPPRGTQPEARPRCERARGGARPGAHGQGSGETGPPGGAVAEKPGYPLAGEGGRRRIWTSSTIGNADGVSASELRGHARWRVSSPASFSRRPWPRGGSMASGSFRSEPQGREPLPRRSPATPRHLIPWA